MGTGSGQGHTDHPGGRRALRSSKGKGRGVLSSQRGQGELVLPLLPLSLPPQEEVVVVGPLSSPSRAGGGGRLGSRGPRRGRSRTPCP